MPTSPTRPGDPRALGRYTIIGRLGRGGMGTVYLGADAGGHRVAVKVINPELAGDAAFHERFRREVTAARQVRRFSTAAVLDARLDGDPLYVVTEYVDGPTLNERVRGRGPMRGGELEGLAVGIATALSAIHAAGVVHRDLKPANVLLSSTGPRVIDFGIARALDAAAEGLTRTGQFIGTPGYIAPELFRGGELTPAADVFAWGCVVAYAGSGRAPFAGATIPEVINRVVNEPPEVGDLDGDLRGLVERALDKDPARRPSTGDLVRELTGHRPPETSPAPIAPAPAPGSVPPARRRIGRRGIAVGVGGTLAAGAVAAALLIPGGTPLRQPEGERPPAPRTVLLRDGFGDPASGWPNASGDCAGYRDGGFLLDILASAGEAETCTAAKPATGTARSLVDVRVSLTAGPRSTGWEAGAHFLKRPGGDDRYDLVLRQDGTARLVKNVGNLRTVLAHGRVAGFEAGGFNRIQAELDRRDPARPRMALWVNGGKVLEHADGDQPLRQGATGLVLYDAGASERVAATFDDFSLAAL